MRITIDVQDADAKLIRRLLKSFGEDQSFTSHGKLDIATLAGMLLQDVSLSWSRPGSWEGANMMQVLSSHGYEH